MRAVDEPDDLRAEEHTVILRVQGRLRSLTAVQLSALAGAFAKHVQAVLADMTLYVDLLSSGLMPGNQLPKPLANCTPDRLP